jgi:hypothetical protein
VRREGLGAGRGQRSARREEEAAARKRGASGRRAWSGSRAVDGRPQRALERYQVAVRVRRGCECESEPSLPLRTSCGTTCAHRRTFYWKTFSRSTWGHSSAPCADTCACRTTAFSSRNHAGSSIRPVERGLVAIRDDAMTMRVEWLKWQLDMVAVLTPLFRER